MKGSFFTFREGEEEHITLAPTSEDLPDEGENVMSMCEKGGLVGREYGTIQNNKPDFALTIYWPLHHHVTCDECAGAFKDEFGLPETETAFLNIISVDEDELGGDKVKERAPRP